MQDKRRTKAIARGLGKGKQRFWLATSVDGNKGKFGF